MFLDSVFIAGVMFSIFSVLISNVAHSTKHVELAP